AGMCKHVAAVLYGIGARLDQQPELLFRLHQVDEKELIAGAGKGLPLSKEAPAATKVVVGEDLAALYGLDMAPPTAAKPNLAKARVGTIAVAPSNGPVTAHRSTSEMSTPVTIGTEYK